MVQEEEIVRTDRTLENSKIHRTSSGYARPQSTVTSNADNHLQNELAKMNTNLILKKEELEKTPQNQDFSPYMWLHCIIAVIKMLSLIFQVFIQQYGWIFN